MIKCLIIDDEPLARCIVLEYLQNYPNIQVMQECGDGFEGVKAIMQHQPDLVFLDIQMPKISGFEMLELVAPTLRTCQGGARTLRPGSSPATAAR